MLANIFLHTLCSDHFQLMCIKLIPVSERSEILEKCRRPSHYPSVCILLITHLPDQTHHTRYHAIRYGISIIRQSGSSWMYLQVTITNKYSFQTTSQIKPFLLNYSINLIDQVTRRGATPYSRLFFAMVSAQDSYTSYQS